MLKFNLKPVANQTFSTLVAGQSCTVNLYTETDGVMYFDLLVSGVPIVQRVICHDRSLLVDMLYLGFIGDFVFQDTQGTSDPFYSGIGTRFLLAYVTPTEALAFDIL